jgi:hypothetical protein
VGKVADEQLVDEVNGPEDPVDDQQDPIVVIVPTDHQRVEAEDEIEEAGVSGFHACKITKKGPTGPFFYSGNR